MVFTDEKIGKIQRKYFPEDLNPSDWESVSKIYKDLLDKEIDSPDDLLLLLRKVAELGSIISEKASRLYIAMTVNADNPENRKEYNEFYSSVIANSMPYDYELKKKFYNSPFRSELPDSEYAHLNRIISNDIELFREENIPLSIEEQELANQYGEILSSLTVDFDGEEKTLTQMGVYQKNNDRNVRESAWRIVMDRIGQEEERLNDLFDKLLAVRIKIAKNAGFENYRDYMHQAMGRFSYTPSDLYKFHESVEKIVIPFLNEITKERKEKLGIDDYKPWDTSVDLDGKTLKPFDKIEDFVLGGIKVLDKVHHDFGMEFNKMANTGFLDLDNRKGKAPGGYCTNLAEHNSSFIFMNAVGLHRDLITLVHEGGHAMHNLESGHIDIEQYRSKPSEIAELASMSMEFLTMDHWGEFYKDKDEMIKAKKDQLVQSLDFLPWCMIVDSFQHWIYTNPEHSHKERSDYFSSLMERFNYGVNFEGLEHERSLRWLRQLHIFEVPFYYIEYGISQLGALSVYRNYRDNPEKAVSSYKKFLSLSYSKPMNEIYESAGIRFDFSQDYISELVDFVKKELESLKS
jgi:oligoendopeptidase F